MKTLPAIERVGGRWQLTVDGEEMRLYAGELHNSSASSLEYLAQFVWPNLRPLNMNALLAPVYWELIEPREGEFDFSLVEGLIEGARREGLRLVLLWFGLWKNGLSHYAPAWVKADQDTFFLARTSGGEPIYAISPFCQAGVQADARAFAALMRFLRAFDGAQQTVLMMQVENEMGILGSARDFCPAAEAAMRQPVPPTVASRYDVSGTWPEAFGEEAGEYLMEWAYAAASEQIAQAGREQYALPMFVNAWLEQVARPGTYPCGGPIARFLPLWQTVAPSIAALAPDIYASNFAQICAQYAAHGNPLLIPEHRLDLRHLSDVIYAVGIDALCFAPFAIEDLCMPPADRGEGDPALMQTLTIVGEAVDPAGSAAYLARAYALLRSLEPLLRAHRAGGRVHAFMRQSEHEHGAKCALEGYDLHVTFCDDAPGCAQAAGIVVQAGEDEFYVAGNCFDYQFLPKVDDRRQAILLRLEKGRFEDGRWQRGRVLNGDERSMQRLLSMPAVQRVVMSRYQ